MPIQHGGVYLVVADGSEEFERALQYAADLAALNHAHVGIFRAMNLRDFQHWGDVEERMREDIRLEAEKHVWEIAKRVNEQTGQVCNIYLEEGDKLDMLEQVMKSDDMVRMVILAAGKGGAPGPLISYFTSKKGIDKLHVPLMVVPADYHVDALDAPVE